MLKMIKFKYGVILGDYMIKIIKADITKSNTDAIVNAANTYLLGGSGVCGAIFRAAGDKELQAECDTLSPINTGEAVITKGYKLKAKYIIHTPGPRYSGPQDAILLRNSYYNSLKLADEYKLESIAFPSISTGIYRYPLEDAAKVAINAIQEFLNDYPNTTIKEIVLCMFDDNTYNTYMNELNKR